MRGLNGPAAAALLLATGALLGAGPTPDRPVAHPRAEVKRLEKAARSGGGDSLKYELALAHVDLATIESRRRALDLYEEIRSSYFHDPRYHWDLSRVYEYAGRISDARRALEEASRLDSADAAAHVHIAELWLRELLRVYDLGILLAMEERLNTALGLDPGRRDALFLLSLTLHLQKALPDADPPELTFRGQEAAARILAADAADGAARLLLAVHDLDLSRVDRAEEQFLAFIDAAPPEVRAVFLTSERTVAAGILGRLRELDAGEHADYDNAWWAYRDPSPLTAVNEAQLEYWKRLAEADFLFGRPKDGVRGWDTEPGEAWVRFGAPNTRSFDPGSVTVDPTATGSDAYKSTIQFNAPAWIWKYRFRGGEFALTFEDRTLQNVFIADKRTAETLDMLRRSLPVIFHDALPGEISTLFVSSAGAAGEAGKVRQNLYFGIGPWRDPAKKDWLEDCRVEVTVRDSTYRPVVRTEFRITPRHVYRPLPDTQFLVLAREINVVPGRYLVVAEVEDGGRDLHGSISLALDVPEMPGTDRLRLSDLDFALTAEAGAGGPTLTRLGRTFVPNPAGLVADERNLDVFYEIYNLGTKINRATWSVRYTVLPLDYVRAFDYHVHRGNARAGMLTGFADRGMVVGGVELVADNHSIVKFPSESAPLHPGETQVKGARVDVAALVPGEYVLVVTVTDEVGEGTAEAMRPFRIVGNDELREMFAFRKEGAR